MPGDQRSQTDHASEGCRGNKALFDFLSRDYQLGVGRGHRPLLYAQRSSLVRASADSPLKSFKHVSLSSGLHPAHTGTPTGEERKMEGTGGGGRAEVSLSGGISIPLYLCQPFLCFFLGKEGHVLYSGGFLVGH